MSRTTKTGRLAGPGSGHSGADEVAIPPRPLVSLLARTPRLIDLLPHLHQHALDVTGGDCSLLFEHNPRNGRLHATSGFGLEELRSEPLTGGGTVNERAVDVQINRLRRKIEQDPANPLFLQAVRGIGYRLVASP